MSQLPSNPKPLTSRKAGALQGTVLVPGDKSISHRALILGALAEGRTEISGLLESEDILCTARALQALGADIQKRDGNWIVTGAGLGGLIEPAAAARLRQFRHGRAPDDGHRGRPSAARRLHRRRVP